MANIYTTKFVSKTRLEDGFLAVIHALCTKQMRRLAVLHAWLQRKSENTLSDWLKLITLYLTVPVFRLHDLLFKVAYLAQQRRIFNLHCVDAGLQLNESLLKFYQLGIALCLVGHGYHVLNQLRKLDYQGDD